MAIWQWALLGLACLWGIQSLGVWFQMRHYSDVMKGVTSRYTDGFVGAGHVRGYLRGGTIVLIVVDRDLKVRRFLEMHGRTVFVKFRRRESVEGMPLDALHNDPAPADGSATARAARQAMDQIERVKERADDAAQEGIGAAEAHAL